MKSPAQNSLSPWNYKPWWCQPWSILLTGVAIITGCWVLTKTIWITLVVSIPIIVWWAYFLVLMPWLIRLSVTQKDEQTSIQDSVSQP
ncbi:MULTISPECIES: DUF6737 family protein [unclassified Coleofasciculus]|uniref:DUF6737 family protein n=1 Tax=unclassified Coleofasciculus TaxID=2692782 RepID=UPI00187F92BB|nr:MULTISPECIES: DUF6737 family protein [unclassified Coleofasciculus]MBE9129694.1 hypothetical protein [Coleofasciculus sp. LEGE 07081]MBE9152204.1 hypothetical protein [Coleofasciculus sp. LEGE 07092]